MVIDGLSGTLELNALPKDDIKDIQGDEVHFDLSYPK